MFSSRATHRMVATTLYLGVMLVTVWGGAGIINYSLDTKFCKDYLFKWKVALKKYSAQVGRWPEFTDKNHVEYMDNLLKKFKTSGLSYPVSNTRRPYIYRINKIGFFKKEHQVFMLALANLIILP